MTNHSGYKITTPEEHDDLLARVDALMRKGEDTVTDEESAQILAMATAIQNYEHSIYTIPAPETLEGMIELKMYEMKLKQKDLAETLGISPVKLSMIINGKQKPDLAFIKAIYHKLKVPADFILNNI